jgi:Lrp/AsnC family leucine-responsive transcriptional regulator
MDDIDRRILTELQRDARLTRADLGRRVGLSPSAAAERLRRLEDAGVILGYRAELDARSVGYGVRAIIRVRPDVGQLGKIAEVAETTPEVIECHRVTGDDCYMLHVILPSIDELEGIIDRFTPMGRTTTSIVNGTPVPRRPIPLPND